MSHNKASSKPSFQCVKCGKKSLGNSIDRICGRPLCKPVAPKTPKSTIDFGQTNANPICIRCRSTVHPHDYDTISGKCRDCYTFPCKECGKKSKGFDIICGRDTCVHLREQMRAIYKKQAMETGWTNMLSLALVPHLTNHTGCSTDHTDCSTDMQVAPPTTQVTPST